jgi:hypothetical protein
MEGGAIPYHGIWVLGPGFFLALWVCFIYRPFEVVLWLWHLSGNTPPPYTPCALLFGRYLGNFDPPFSFGVLWSGKWNEEFVAEDWLRSIRVLELKWIVGWLYIVDFL